MQSIVIYKSDLYQINFLKNLFFSGMLPLLFITPEERKADDSEKTTVDKIIGEGEDDRTADSGNRTADSSRTADSRPAKGLS
jgi:hypothetical protein